MLDKLYQCTSSTEQVLPDNPGVYFFFLSGLHRSRVPETPDFNCKESWSKYISYMTYRIERLATLKEKVEWEGFIKEKKSQGISAKLVLEGIRAYDLLSIRRDLKEIKCVENMNSYIDAINKAIILSGPIYVGMTERQSISTRYGQHLRDSQLLNSKQKKFGSRLTSLGISWGDLAIGFIELPWQEHGLSRKIERGFHSIVNPFLSVG